MTRLASELTPQELELRNTKQREYRRNRLDTDADYAARTKEKARATYLANREIRLAYQLERRLADPEAARAKQRAYRRKKNPESVVPRVLLTPEESRARHKEKTRLWDEAHREHNREKARRNRTGSNRERALASQRRSRERSREWFNSLKDFPCMDCGVKHHPHAMEWDHRDGEVKLYTPSKMVQLSKEKVLAELAKCDLVCAICHRKRTTDRRNRDSKRRD
jgi:hypothetical protein